MTSNFLLVFPPPTSLFPHNEFACSLFIFSSFRPLHNSKAQIHKDRCFRVSWAKSQQEKLRGSTDAATWEGQGSLMADLLILCSVVLQMPVNVPSGPHVRGSTASSWDSVTCDRPRTNLLGQHGQGLISEQQSHMPVDSHSWVQAGSDLLKRLDSFLRSENGYLYLQLSSFSISFFSCFSSRQDCLDPQDKPLNIAAQTSAKLYSWNSQVKKRAEN